MPLFYFDMRTPQGVEPDEIGLDLGSAEAAYLEACAAVPGISLDLMRKGGIPGGCSFEVRDALGQVHWEIPFGEILGRLPELSHPRPRIP